MKTYYGRDFALDPETDSWCRLTDDGESFLFDFDHQHLDTFNRCAVDCPLGVSIGHLRLLRGEIAGDRGGDSFQTRETDRWARTHIPQFGIAAVVHRYFNPTAHVRSPTAMSIIPGCLFWLANESINAGASNIATAFEKARRGEGRIIEAHPRLFLYSAVERVFRVLDADARVANASTLNRLAQYRTAANPDRAQDRAHIYNLLRDNPTWMGQNVRSLPELPEGFIESDHHFDAWLSALTAWAHDHGETVTWDEAGLDEECVNSEGHILILRQN